MVRTVTQILAEIQADTIAENPSLCDWSLNSFNRRKTIPIAVQVQKLEKAIDSAAAAHLVPSATGAQLNELVADRGLTRLGGTKALGQVTFIRNTPAGANITIPLGTQVSTQDTDGDGAVFLSPSRKSRSWRGIPLSMLTSKPRRPDPEATSGLPLSSISREGSRGSTT